MTDSSPLCVEHNCEKLASVRGFCNYHYGVRYRAGTLPPKVTKTVAKSLTDIDHESGVATCQKHGLVKIRVRRREGGTTYYACRNCERGKWEDTPEGRRAATRRRRANNPIGYREASLRRRRKQFGWNEKIGVKEYDMMLAAQGGRCAICRCPPKENVSLAIDHDHSTGSVRGLLCNVCNWALGRFKDDPKRFDTAAAYLRAAENSHAARN